MLTHFPTDTCERSTRTPRGDARRTASVTAIQGRIRAGDGVGRVHASKMLRAAYMREPVKRSHVELHDALFSKPPPGRTTAVDALFGFTKNHRQALEQLTSPHPSRGAGSAT